MIRGRGVEGWVHERLAPGSSLCDGYHKLPPKLRDMTVPSVEGTICGVYRQT